jgi:hypothetical protein
MENRVFIRWVIPYVSFCLLLTLIGVYTAKAQCPAASPLVINSVTPTASRCQASGTATVSASGGATPYTYSITAGPSTAPAQSSNVFTSLTPGTYTVQVADNCNTSVTASVTVTGSYTVPSPTATTTSTSCPGSSDGSLTIGITGGLGPFSYSLVSPSPVTVGPQAGNVFTGLSAGTYTYQVTDSCGNFQTRTATVAAGSPGTANVSSGLLYEACDSFAAEVFLYAPDFKPPYTLTATLPNGEVMTDVLSASAFSSGSATVYFYFRYHHVTGASDPLTFTVTSNCGSSSISPLTMALYLDMSESRNDPTGCGSGYSYTLDQLGNIGAHCSTITYTLISPAGVALAVQTNNSTFSGYPPGNGYKVIRQDCCEKDSLTFNWDSPPSYSSVEVLDADPTLGCKANTTTEYLLVTANFTKSIVLASGPPSVTFSDGTVHTYTYPDTLQNPGLSDNVIYLSGITAGTYKIYDLDVCGGMDSAVFTVHPSNLLQTAFAASGKVTCGGGGSILLKSTSNNPYASISVDASTVFNIAQSLFVDSVTGLSPGTYDVAYHSINEFGSFLPLMYPTGMPTGCDVIMDTVIVPGYVQPSFSTTPAIANCGTTRDLALLPDSASGVKPYEFQIIAGPETTVAQSSPVFSGLAAGTYTFQMSDACGNSYSSNISIDTLTVPNVTTTGVNCAGGAATFTLPVSAFSSYTWQHPDGTITTGDTLSFNPITNADTGTYKITATSTIGGCTSTSTQTIELGFCTVLQEALLHFRGQQENGDIQLNWQMADQAGVGYYIVERSTDGIAFTPVQEVAATNAAQDSYTAIDTHVPSGVVYYRLQMVGNNGVINYSQTISFNMDNTSIFNVMPTLITGNTPVRCTYPGASNTGFIRVVGVDGRVYRKITVPAGSTATSIDIAGLANGYYFVVFAGNDTVAAIQVWKE